MKRQILLLILLASFCFSSFAQKKKTMFLDKVDTICNNTKVNFNVRAKNFTNVIGFQGSIGWDSSVLKFDSIKYSTNSSINLNDSNTNIQSKSSYLNFAWVDSVGHNLLDSSILFTLQFKVKNAIGNATPIYFNSGFSFTSNEIDTVDVVTQIPVASPDTSFINGYIVFVDTPKIIQSGNTLTCIASCNPKSYQWYINGVLVTGDTLNTITISTSGPYTVSVVYFNGNRVSSAPTSVVLAVDLVKFTGEAKAGNVYLNWTSAYESSNPIYYIQRRTGNGDFVTIGKVYGKGFASSNYEYSYTDYTAKGSVAYRIAIMNKNGNIQYSKVVNFNLGFNSSEIVFYPNPAHNFIHVEGKNLSTITIVDNVGKTILSSKGINTDEFTSSIQKIDISTLSRGIYFIKAAFKNGFIKTEKLIIE